MNDEQYYDFVRPYEDAMQMLLTRLDVLNHSLYGTSDSQPIHYIQDRIKQKKSLEEKLCLLYTSLRAACNPGFQNLFYAKLAVA